MLLGGPAHRSHAFEKASIRLSVGCPLAARDCYMKIGGSIYEMVKTISIPLRIFPFGTIKRNVIIEIGRSSQFARSGYLSKYLTFVVG